MGRRFIYRAGIWCTPRVPCCALGAVTTGLYLWQRNVAFVIISRHFLLDLPIVRVAVGVLPPM
jgi:hypothetical protein